MSESLSLRKKKRGAHVAKRRYISTSASSASSATPSPNPVSAATSISGSKKQRELEQLLCSPTFSSGAPDHNVVASLVSLLTVAKVGETDTLDIDSAIAAAGGPHKVFLPLVSLLTSPTELPIKVNASLILTNLTACSDLITLVRHANNDIWLGNLIEGTVATLTTVIDSGDLSADLSADLSTEMRSLTNALCWILGNLSGDCDEIRLKVFLSGAHLILTRIFNSQLRLFDESAKGTLLQQHQQKNFSEDFNEMPRTAAWAISNLVRIDFAAGVLHNSSSPRKNHSTLSFITPSAQLSEDDFLSPCALVNFVKCHTILATKVTYVDANYDSIIVEVLWILTFLTARDGVLAAFHAGEVNLSEVIVRLLKRATDMYISDPRTMEKYVTSVIPSVRILGNIATCSNGRFINFILSLDLISVLLVLLDGERMNTTISKEVAWLTGALTCDVGLNGRDKVYEVGIAVCPILVANLIKGGFAFDYLNECACSLWNCIAPPPMTSAGAENRTENILFPPTPPVSPNANSVILPEDNVRLLMSVFEINDGALITPLCDMIRVLDGGDGVEAALRLISSYLKYGGKIAKEKCLTIGNVEAALEVLCENAVHWPREKSWLADEAADLVDNFFGNDDYGDDDRFEDAGMAPTQVVVNGSGQQFFSFGTTCVSDNTNGLSFGTTTAATNSANTCINNTNTAAASGLGRGRGMNNKPAWMS